MCTLNWIEHVCDAARSHERVRARPSSAQCVFLFELRALKMNHSIACNRCGVCSMKIGFFPFCIASFIPNRFHLLFYLFDFAIYLVLLFSCFLFHHRNERIVKMEKNQYIHVMTREHRMREPLFSISISYLMRQMHFARVSDYLTSIKAINTFYYWNLCARVRFCPLQPAQSSSPTIHINAIDQ